MDLCPRCGRPFRSLAMHRTRRRPDNPCAYSPVAWRKILEERRAANVEKTKRWRDSDPGIAHAQRLQRRVTAHTRQKNAERARRVRAVPDGYEWRKRLTRRQLEMLELLAIHDDRASAATAAGISLSTFDNHMMGVYSRLEVTNAIGAFRRIGWLVPIRLRVDKERDKSSH